MTSTDAAPAMPRPRRVALVGRPGIAGVPESLAVVQKTLAAAGVEQRLEANTATLLGQAGGIPREAISDDVDLIVVVGGDGSILGVARAVAHAGVPVLGVNRGGLGFLADIAPPQIAAKLGAVLEGIYRVEDRFLLAAEVRRDGETQTSSPMAALNDVVVHAGSVSRMMDFELFVDGEFVYEQRSDGVIVATPTGSTAYALSAGGPIMHPRLDAVAVVPMFPHTLTSRPLVVHGESGICIRIGSAAVTPKVSCDSQLDRALAPNDEVVVRKHVHPLQLAFPLGHNFYQSCRSKLDWATRLSERRERGAAHEPSQEGA